MPCRSIRPLARSLLVLLMPSPLAQSPPASDPQAFAAQHLLGVAIPPVILTTASSEVWNSLVPGAQLSGRFTDWSAAMKSITAGFAICSFLIVAFSQAQAAPKSTGDQQSTLLISEAISAIAGDTSITDSTMTGTATSGTDAAASGTISLEMLATQYGRLDLVWPSGSFSLIRNDNNPDECGIRVDSSSAKSVAIAPHQCWMPAAWFLPLSWLTFAMAPNAVTAYVGPESHNDIKTDHIHVYQDFSDQSKPVRTLLQGLTSVDLYLDCASHLPVAIGLSDTTDDNAGANLPGEIQFSNYQKSDTATLPYEIKRFSQGVLLLDITLSKVLLNSGLTSSDFQLQ